MDDADGIEIKSARSQERGPRVIDDPSEGIEARIARVD